MLPKPALPLSLPPKIPSKRMPTMQSEECMAGRLNSHQPLMSPKHKDKLRPSLATTMPLAEPPKPPKKGLTLKISSRPTTQIHSGVCFATEINDEQFIVPITPNQQPHHSTINTFPNSDPISLAYHQHAHARRGPQPHYEQITGSSDSDRFD